MKKTGLILAAAVLLGTFLSGCKEEEVEIKNEKHDSITATEAINSNEIQEQEQKQSDKKNKERNAVLSQKSCQFQLPGKMLPMERKPPTSL